MLRVQIGGANDNVIVDMMLVDVSRNDVSELIIGHPGGQFFPDLICFLRRDLFWLESLADVIADHFVFLCSSGVLLVLLEEKHELIRCRFERAGVS